MDLQLSLGRQSGRTGLAEQIHRQLAQLIRDAVLTPGDLLPSTRVLATRLSVSRATVVSAYERLALDGLIVSRVGVGAVVRPPTDHQKRSAAPRTEALRAQPLWDEIAPPRARAAEPPAPFNFRLGRPAVEHFPYSRWRALLSDQFRVRAWADGSYPDPAGNADLRAAIARHLALNQALAADPARIVVTSGAQQAVDLVARVLTAPGDVVAVEDPGYRPVLAALRANRLRVVGVPVDDTGLVVEAIPAAARLVYVTPSHQFPLGTTMTYERRAALLDWADRRDAAVIEDDYDSEFRYAGRRVEALQAMDEAGRVLYVGSFSKTLLPALRIGFLLATPRLATAVAKAKFASDFGTPGHIQRALATFIDEGGFAKHIRRMRRVYEQRHHAIRQTLLDVFADVLTPVDSLAGLHLAARLAPGHPRTDRDVTRAALAGGVDLEELSRWGIDRPGPQGLLFGYGAIPVERIGPGLALLRPHLDR